MALVDKIIDRNEILVEKYSAETLLEGSGVVVYGAGEGYVALQRTTLQKLNINPILVVDKKYSDNEIHSGIQCCNIEYLTKNTEKYNNCIAIVTLGSISTANNIKNTLNKIGFMNTVWAPDLYEYSLHHQSIQIDDEGANFFIRQSDKIDKAYDSLMDEKSKKVFNSLLTRYITGKPSVIPFDSFDKQYVPKDILPAMESINYVCCGAFDGDSIRKIIGTYGRLVSVCSFEPDPINYSKLCNYTFHNKNEISDNIINVPCGVYSETKSLRFAAGDSLSSTIDAKGDSVIQVVSLDDMISGSNVTYITMDVEGAELEALNGAENTLKQQTPNLAISIYHYPEHLWDIIIYLLNLKLGYKFYIRNYSGFTYESILYAIK